MCQLNVPALFRAPPLLSEMSVDSLALTRQGVVGLIILVCGVNFLKGVRHGARVPSTPIFAIQGTDNNGNRVTIKRNTKRIPVMPSDLTGTTEGGGTIQPAL